MKSFFRRFASIISAALFVMTTFFSVTAKAYDKSYTAYMIGNAHIDAAWLWPVPETIREVNTTFTRALDLMDKNPDYRFTQSASLYYKWAEEYYPDMFNRLKEKVANGQWEIVGGQVIEPDLNLTSGESLVRQTLYGKRYFRDKFGVDVKIGWVPDVFGFGYQVPQILKKSGMDYFVTTKPNWNENNKFPYEIFNWKGLDGSQLLTYKPKYDYPTIYNKDMINSTLDFPNSLGIKKSMALYGAGDHGGGPNQQNINDLKSYDSDPNMPKVKMSTAGDYFKDVQSMSDVLPIWDNEIYFENHRGTYTTQGAMKKYNRTSEIKAEEAEKFASIATWLGTETYPKDKIDKAWEKINLNQFHDILPGSAINQVYHDAWDDEEVALNYLNSSIKNALTGITSRINTLGDGTPLIVFNPLSWKRSGLVEATMVFDNVPSSIKVVDSDDIERPVQIVNVNGKQVKFVFEANNVPSMGYKVFKVKAGDGQKFDTGLKVNKDSNTIENNFFRVEINSKTGNISRIYDKVNKREVLEERKEGNVLQILEDTPREWDAWNVDKDDMEAAPVEINKPVSIEVIEKGPVKATIRVKKEYSLSNFVQDIILYADTNRIDVKMSADWHESHKALKVAFPLSVNPSKATYEIGYGAIERSTTRDNSFDAARFEVSGQKWADMSKDGYGVSILNDSKYGWDALNNRIRLTLLRSPKWPDGNADMGHHEFTYSIYPHSGDWKDANTVDKGYELNYPLLGMFTTTHKGDLPKIHSFISVDAPNVVISVVKKVEEKDSDDLIIRIYDSEGKNNTIAKINLPAKIISAKEVNLVEDDIGEAGFNGHKLTTSLGKYEIKTFRVKLEKQNYRDTKPIVKTIDLSKEFNLDGMSYDKNRKDGNLDGYGNTFSANLMPDKVVSEDVTFNIGPKADGKNNIVVAKGQTISLDSGSYKYIYILAAKAGPGKSSGMFTVNYADGTQGGRYIAPTDWTSLIGGWNKPIVKDTIGYFMTHNHSFSGDNLAKDNYLFVYRIGLDSAKSVKSITLPDAPAIKIAAMSLVNGDGIPAADLEAPTQVTELKANVPDGIYSDVVNLSWNSSKDNIAVDHYNVYRSTRSDFSDAILLVETSDTKFSDNTLNAHGRYFYMITAEDAEGNAGPESDILSVTAGPNIAIGRPVKSDRYVSNEQDFKAVDGTVLDNSKWCATGSEPHWLMVDLGEKISIRKFVIKHAGAGGETPIWNTRDFKIQVSDDGTNWRDVVNVTGNTENITSHLVENVSARYARLYITRATSDTKDSYQGVVARIYEFEVWGLDTKSVPTSAPVLKYATPDNGKVTLKFTPVASASEYEIRYGTESGKYENSIRNVTDTEYTVTGLKNDIPYYFVVAAVNPYGTGPLSNELAAAPVAQRLNIGVDLTNYYNVDGMSTDKNPGDGNFDAAGWCYSADLIPDKTSFEGVEFNFGPKVDGSMNVVASKGQTINLPSNSAIYLDILAAAHHGTQTGEFTVTYEDGSTEKYSLSFTDWCSTTATNGEKVALSFDHRHDKNGDTSPATKIFFYQIPLNNTKKLKAVQLPNNDKMKLFSISLDGIDLVPQQ